MKDKLLPPKTIRHLCLVICKVSQKYKTSEKTEKGAKGNFFKISSFFSIFIEIFAEISS